MKTVILSDIHLDANPDGRDFVNAFATDLPRIVGDDTRRLIVLGDLFDFWFEYKHVVFSGYFEVLRVFAELRDQGVEMHLVCGNHDFWAGRFLRDHLGFVIHQKPVVMDFDGRRVWLMHGDGFNQKDYAYRAYKWLARSKPVIGLFGMIHPDIAMDIARRVSRTSRRLTLQEDPTKGAEALALAEYAKDILAQGKADVVIAGHAHAPAMMEFPTPNNAGAYINTGDWMYHRSYVVWDNGEFEMKRDGQVAGSR